MDASAEKKLEYMKSSLQSMGRVAVAFSAGVDSTFVLKIAVDALGPENVVAFTAESDSLPRYELEEAKKLAEELGVEHVIIHTDEVDSPAYRSNPVDRCYHCRVEFFQELEDAIAIRNIKNVVIGVNADDYYDWRPGLNAAREAGARMPAADAGFSKAEIRAISREMGLATFDKPSSPCLATRVPYGEPITREKLQQIEKAEDLLHSLGFRECRVRHHGSIARVEVPVSQLDHLLKEDVRAKVEEHLRGLGFAYVTVDLRGFRSGSMNETIDTSAKSPS
jgi:uncharacterized protein